jgi:hypothetical protein
MTAFTLADAGIRSCIVAQKQCDVRWKQLAAMRGGLTVEQWRRKVIRKWKGR